MTWVSLDCKLTASLKSKLEEINYPFDTLKFSFPDDDLFFDLICNSEKLSITRFENNPLTPPEVFKCMKVLGLKLDIREPEKKLQGAYTQVERAQQQITFLHQLAKENGIEVFN